MTTQEQLFQKQAHLASLKTKQRQLIALIAQFNAPIQAGMQQTFKASLKIVTSDIKTTTAKIATLKNQLKINVLEAAKNKAEEVAKDFITKSPPAKPTPTAQGSTGANVLDQQNEALKQQQELDRLKAELKAKKTKQALVITGAIVGGLLLIGGTILIIKKVKSKKD